MESYTRIIKEETKSESLSIYILKVKQYSQKWTLVLVFQPALYPIIKYSEFCGERLRGTTDTEM